MWLLSCDGDLFGGKRLWLRPGSTHLLGRTSGKAASGERVQYIDHKSVSRKHLVLKIDEIKPGASISPSVRWKVQAIDGSKTGTTIDGEKFTNETKVLTGDAHLIKLGGFASSFHLEWHPVVLSLTTLPKAAKARTETLAAQRKRLEPAGIRVVPEYVNNETTHLIAKKRNTAAGLEALVQGKWLLTDSFVEALGDACERKRGELDEELNTSLLEEDFDANWPKEEEYVVPAGNEPTPRPNEYLKPKPGRAGVFESFTFVFLSQTQYDQLLPVVTSGGGKAVVYPFELGESTTADVLNFVSELGGERSKRPSHSRPKTTKGSTIVVRSVSKEEGREQEITRSIELALNQRSMEQNEFLEAILTNNASILVRSLSTAPSDNAPHVAMRSPPASPRDETTILESPRAEDELSTVLEQQAEQVPQESSATSTKRRPRHLVTASRFTGFDDFDVSQVVRPASGSPEPPSPNGASSTRAHESNSRQTSSRKRYAVEDPAEAERRLLDRLAPSTAGAKRRRLEQQPKPQEAASVPAAKETRSKMSKESAEILNMDIKGALKERMEQEDERRRADEEYLRNALDVDIREIGHRVPIESFELPVRPGHSEGEDKIGGDNDIRWDPAWNGRANFKRFRRLRQTQQEDAPARRPKRLVALEEVPKRGLLLDDEYFLQSSSDPTSRSRSQTQSQSTASRHTGPDSGDPYSGRAALHQRLERSREEDAETADLDAMIPEQGTARTTQTLVADSQRRAPSKRPAVEPLNTGAAKKPRQARLGTTSMARSTKLVESDDDDDDALKFRRKKR